MNHIYDEYLFQVKNIFQNTSNKYEAHLKAHPILTKMARDIEVIHEGMKRAMQDPKFFYPSSCGGPDFQINLLDIPEVSLFASFFGPNKDKVTDYSYSTMHHHDDFLLSTINAKGIGYSSLIWNKGYNIDHSSKKVEIELDKYVKHPHMNIEFIDSHTAHTIFYPSDLTMTYALWSTSYPTKPTSKFKDNVIIQKNKHWIKKAINLAKIKPSKIGAALYREDYFVPKDGKIILLPGQVNPPDGDHAIENRLHILQEFLEFDDTNFLKEDLYPILKNGKMEEATDWVEKFIDNEPIKRNYESYDAYVQNRNVHIDEYKSCYPQLENFV